MRTTLALASLAVLLVPVAAQARPAAAKLSPEQLRVQMRQLWRKHILWTRMVIVSFEAGSPDLQAAETRLLRNQADIGNAIKPYYGAAAGTKLTALLRQHILDAVPVPAAAQAGDKAKLADAQQAWYANANEVDHLQGKWAADIRDYDEVEAEILGMADTLSAGIVKQFPSRFAGWRRPAGWVSAAAGRYSARGWSPRSRSPAGSRSRPAASGCSRSRPRRCSS